MPNIVAAAAARLTYRSALSRCAAGTARSATPIAVTARPPTSASGTSATVTGTEAMSRPRGQSSGASTKVMVVAAKSRPCADCGVRYPPYVMDLDHVRGKKVRNVGLIKTYATTAVLRAEIAKCEVVCANCHRIRSHNRRETKESG